MENLLTACATRGLKPINQDACDSTVNAVVVADGLGSFFKAEVASKFAAETLKAKLEGSAPAELESPLWYGKAFAEIQKELEASPLADLGLIPESQPKEAAYGTTLLCAVAHPEALTIAYVGNGAILHLRGGFDEFPATVILPWNAVNYLNPHSIAQGGKNAMTRYIAAVSNGQQCTPTVLQLQQDIQGTGDILILCSDGIHAADQINIGRDSERNIWLSGDEGLVILYKVLAEFLKGPDRTSETLRFTLERYLDALVNAQLITDDCTVAVLITPTALAYYGSEPSSKETDVSPTEVALTHGTD